MWFRPRRTLANVPTAAMVPAYSSSSAHISLPYLPPYLPYSSEGKDSSLIFKTLVHKEAL